METNDMGQMREALEEADTILSVIGYSEGTPIRRRIREVLSNPVRNCDVGTPEEQSVRMAEFCREQYKKTDGVMLCSGCRFHDLKGYCQFAWAQMPYEGEVEGKEG